MVKKTRLQLRQLELRHRYNLCIFCTMRHSNFGPTESLAGDFGSCFICRGLMNQLDYLGQLIESEVDHTYDFDTFSIGISLPHDFFDREDQIRAKYKIKGNESIKSQLQNELRERYKLKSRKKLSFEDPDLSVNVIIKPEEKVRILARSKPLTFAGRYIKRERGVPQRQQLCKKCEGRGCDACDHVGHSERSIEGIVSSALVRVTKGKSPKFTWVGSEDSSSLVCGKGRPFFVRLSDPKLKSLRGGLIVSTNDIEVLIEEEPKSMPHSPIRFITRAKVLVETSNEFDIGRINALSQLNSTTVKFQNKNRSISKKIYTIEVSRVTNRRCEMEMLVEGGFTIKKFVSGYDNTVPNVSYLVGTRCESKIFDILEVIVE